MSAEAELPGLAELGRQPDPIPPPLSPMLEAELERLAPAPPRRPVRQLALLVAISIIYGAGVLAVVAMRHDLSDLPMHWVLGVAVAWLAGFLVPMYLALVPRPGSALPRAAHAGAAAAIAALTFVGLGLVLHPEPPTATHLPTLGAGLGCLHVGLATSLVPAVIGAIFLRGALPVGARWTAAALGAGGGSLGGLVLHLHCRVSDALHVGLIHGGVVAVAAVLAAALVPRATELR